MLGGGQLGRMFAMAAKRMGYRVVALSPDSGGPAVQVADGEIVGDYTDEAALARLAAEVDAVSIEFENIPAGALNFLAERVPVRPGAHVLHTTQNRLREKTALKDAGFPVTPFAPVHSLGDLVAGLETLGVPAVLKTAGFGYDGKGQQKITDVSQAEKTFGQLDGVPGILEGFVDFEREVSMIAGRNADGRIVTYDVIENRHHRHILDVSAVPAAASDSVTVEARRIAEAVMTQLDVVGVLCVEFFLLPDNRLLINELAPRPHNSGHLTIEACITSQFEQQVRMLCNLPPGDPSLRQPAAMANLLGDLWFDESGNRQEPDWRKLMADYPGVKLHLYGKTEPRPGRKMGHLTAVADTPGEAVRAVTAARARLMHCAAGVI